jgi:hypothetical protein
MTESESSHQRDIYFTSGFSNELKQQAKENLNSATSSQQHNTYNTLSKNNTYNIQATRQN